MPLSAYGWSIGPACLLVFCWPTYRRTQWVPSQNFLRSNPPSAQDAWLTRVTTFPPGIMHRVCRCCPRRSVLDYLDPFREARLRLSRPLCTGGLKTHRLVKTIPLHSEIPGASSVGTILTRRTPHHSFMEVVLSSMKGSPEG